ncbi:sterol carrier family protein [uncultured Corynebacterium sp.]|mgnify:FL=1|uniref:sterol carrier family protein n=1 Tax=uncultured Corynebacterium sp. TaxID=159447 RepID=UPI0025CE051C|nr:sterol carrier family protein [uncultured Corynebacterium sp.]
MKRSLTGPELSTAAREAVAAVLDWIRDPEGTPAPGRTQQAAAVRLSTALLVELAPGNSVEVRVPPFAAVQCVAGPNHRRGTPPNVVQCSPLEWLRLVVGEVAFSSSDADSSGTRAGEISSHLPLLRFS